MNLYCKTLLGESCNAATNADFYGTAKKSDRPQYELKGVTKRYQKTKHPDTMEAFKYVNS